MNETPPNFQWLQDAIAERLERMRRKFFTADVKLTLVARKTTMTTADVIVTADDYRQVVRAIVRLQPDAAEDPWQPIETAAKEHKRVILLYACEQGRHIYGRGYWFQGVPGDGEGWIASVFYSAPEDDMRGSFTPTHWKPMPAPAWKAGNS